jgi:oligopeptide transport system permease protein
MTAYLIRRLLWLVPVLLFVAAITFALMHSVPGGPWDRDKPLPPAAVEQLNRKYGLDQPLWEQFGRYLLGLLQGDLGVSYRQSDRPVTEVIGGGIKVSATLGGLAMLVSAAVGVPLGIVAALRRNRALDYLSVSLATLGASTPNFVLGIILIVIFASTFHLLPTIGWGSWKQAIMPVLALSALPTAFLARITRASTLEVLQQDYVRTAWAKGLSVRAVVLRHVARNALIPVLTLAGPLAAALVTGSFIIESQFAIPGVGRAFVTAIFGRDYGVIMGVTLFYALVVATANLAVDLAYAAADPRIRYR